MVNAIRQQGSALVERHGRANHEEKCESRPLWRWRADGAVLLVAFRCSLCRGLSRTLVMGLVLALGLAGCAPSSETYQFKTVRVARVKRTSTEKAQLIDPGKLGGNGAANVRRGFFNFWNEQIIREDVAVGTVFLGDSITELWNLDVYFQPALGEIIQNRGISGDLAAVMARRFEADVIQLRPRNVVILAGTNDVADMIREKKGDDEIINSVSGWIEQMMDSATSAEIKVFVCSILPTHDQYRLHEERTELRARINERIKAACVAKGCFYVDYAAEMSDPAGNLRKNLARDGLHPHYAGYEIMTRVLKTAAKVNGVVL